MPLEQSIKELEQIDLPWNKHLTLKEVLYEGGMTVLRLQLREGRRFTTLDLDPDSVAGLADKLAAWARSAPPAPNLGDAWPEDGGGSAEQ